MPIVARWRRWNDSRVVQLIAYKRRTTLCAFFDEYGDYFFFDFFLAFLQEQNRPSFFFAFLQSQSRAPMQCSPTLVVVFPE
jgi:hypothetical protein